MANETTKRFLESLEIASPCHVDWDEMTGDERARFCMHCEKKVYNISEMSRVDAEAFMRKREGSICIRMYRRHDGTVINDNCPVGLRKVRQELKAGSIKAARLWKIVAASFALVSALFSASAGQAQDDKVKDKTGEKVEPKKTDRASEKTPTPPTGAKSEPPIVPTMGIVAPEPTEGMIKAELNYKQQVSALIAPKIKGKHLKEGVVTFHVDSAGQIDQCNMGQSTGDKALDESLLAAVKGQKLTLAADGSVPWRWISVCLSEPKSEKPKPSK